jgi:hypothetical protein
MLLQIIVQKNIELHQIDVKTAYLNAPIDCEIYLEPPEGFQRKSEKSLVWKLTSHLWIKTVREELEPVVT